MNQQEAMADLREFIRERFTIPKDDADFNDDIHLFDYGYVDSFGAVELITFVKKQFGVEVSGSDLMVHPLNTVRQIAGFVVERQALKG